MLAEKNRGVGDVLLDELIRQALRERVAGAEPSPAVWERIHWRAKAWVARCRPETYLNWPVAIPQPAAPQGGLTTRRYDSVAAWAFGWWGGLCRLGG